MPKFADARFSLGLRLRAHRPRAGGGARAGRGPGASTRGHYRANLLLGRILSLQGQAAAACPTSQTAAASAAASGEAHAFLADAYEQLGRARGRRARAGAGRARPPRAP